MVPLKSRECEMKRMMRGLAACAALALTAVTGGCAGNGWEDVVYGGRDGWGGATEMRGEVRDVSERYRVIRVERDNGRTAQVRYDGRTEVVYGDRRVRATALNHGDYVSMRVSRDSRGELYTRHVTVRRIARDSRDRGGYDDRRGDRRRDDRWDDRRDDRRDERYDARAAEGRVGRVDRSARRFELHTDRGTVWVNLSGNASRGVRERFGRLRQGDRVRVSGRYVANGRFQMDSFR